MMPAELAPRAGGLPRPLADSLQGVLAWCRGLAWQPVLRSWAFSRAVVLLALAAAQLLHLHDADLRTEGLLGWDAAWYHRIAEVGYSGLEDEAVRFFPLLPALARALAPLTLGSTGVALVVLANAGALVSGLLLHRLALREGLGRAVADRAVWVAALVPAGFVDVMGYTEPLYVALVCGLLLAARGPASWGPARWWGVALLGLLVGALRPPGVVLGVVVAIEAARGLRAAGPGERLARAVAVLAPAAGLGAFLLRVQLTRGDGLLPFRAQVIPGLRGGTVVDPLPGVLDAVRGAAHLQLQGAGLHVLWAALCLGLLVVAWRRLPLSYAVLGGVTVLLGVTARSMTSFERYAGSAVPLLLAAALVLSTPARRSTSLVVAPVLLGVYALMAFLHLYVP